MTTLSAAQNLDIERVVNEQKMRGYLESEYSQRQQYVDEMRESNRRLWFPARLIGLNGGKWYQKCYEVLP